MMLTILTNILAIAGQLAFTYCVGRNLHRNGQIFLMDAFDKDEEKATAINNLLIVGFYLVNCGFVFFLAGYAEHIQTYFDAMQTISFRYGLILITLGVMHFLNMKNIARIRSKALRKHADTTFA